MAEIAVFGGTFDPPTIAHQAIIESCYEHPEIDEVWVMPSRKRTDKPGMSPDGIRIAMLECLLQAEYAGVEQVKVSDFEMQLPAPTETWRTVEALESAHPDHNFWYVWGADSYASMHTWNRGTELRQNLGMLLVERVGYDLPPETEQIKHLTFPPERLGISSTMVRQAFADNDPYSINHVAPAVAQFIGERQLYKAS